jgi:salicylate hydroxylase
MDSPSPSTTPPLSIAIIGAGIASITLAIALSEHNPSISLTIFESRPSFNEISAGVGFGPNALKAMALISPKILSAYDTVKTKTWILRRIICGMSFGGLIQEA